MLLCLRASARACHATATRRQKVHQAPPNTHTGLHTLSTDSVVVQVEGGHRFVVLESFSKSLPRKGNKEAESPPGSPNTHTGLPTLSTDFVAPQVEGGHRFVVLESFSKSLPRKGNKEAESPPGSQNTRTGLPTLITDVVAVQVEGGDGFVVLQASCKGLAHEGNKEATASALSVPIFVPLPNEPPPGPRAPGRHGGNQSKSERPNNQCLPWSLCVCMLTSPHLQLSEGRMVADGLRQAHENLTATQAACMLGG